MDRIYKTALILLCIIFQVPMLNAQEQLHQNPTDYIYYTDGQRIISHSTRKSGKTYKLEIIKVPVFDKNDPAIKELSKIGKITTEYWIDNEQYSILVGEYKSLDDAKKNLQKLKRKGHPQASIVTYVDGLRM